MKSSKSFNNISEQLKKEIPKLKPGEVKTFQMLNGVPNPDPDPRQVSAEPILYGKKQIKTNFRIFDKHKDEYVDVGAVERWDGETPSSFIMLVPGMEMGSRFQGKFSLSGGNVRDEELWEILYLSPEREDTPCEDKSIAPLFRLLDFKKENKQSTTRFDVLKEAVGLADGITEEKAREVMSALNKPSYDKETLMGKVRDLARLEPDQFISAYKSQDTPIKAIVRSAIDANILEHDFASGKVKLGGIEITTMKLETSDSFVSNFTTWLGTAENGKNVLNNIKSQLGKKKDLAK